MRFYVLQIFKPQNLCKMTGISDIPGTLTKITLRCQTSEGVPFRFSAGN